jgi:hypothetical protein
MCKLDSLDLLSLKEKSWTDFLKDFLREGPSGMDGRNRVMFASVLPCDSCSSQEDMFPSSSLREDKGFGAESLENRPGFAAKGCGTKYGSTYGRLLDSSIDVNNLTAALFCPSVGVEYSSFMYDGGLEYCGGCEGVCGSILNATFCSSLR